MITWQMVVASDGSHGLGHQGRIPWNCPADRAWFRDLTGHKPVIVGRTTWVDIYRRAKDKTKILPTRTPIVLTLSKDPLPGYPIRVTGPEEAIQVATQYSTGQAAVIGGKQIYELFLPMITDIYWTRIAGSYPADTFLAPRWLDDFRLAEWQMADDHTCDLLTLRRKGR